MAKAEKAKILYKVCCVVFETSYYITYQSFHGYSGFILVVSDWKIRYLRLIRENLIYTVHFAVVIQHFRELVQLEEWYMLLIGVELTLQILQCVLRVLYMSL